MRSLVLAAVLSLPRIGQPEPLPDADYAALARAVIDQVAIPAYAAYAQATKGLGPVIEAHCTGSSAADAAAIHTAFDETMDAWQRAWPFTFGPVMHGAGRARIAFWPDRRGSAARQMRTVLRTRDEALLDVEKLAGKSVAIKDLQALERLLFAVPRDAYTCGLARTIAHHQSEIAAEILDAWTGEDGFRQTALAAGGDNDRYADDAEVARDLMRSLTESLDAVIAQKLQAPLGGRRPLARSLGDSAAQNRGCPDQRSGRRPLARSLGDSAAQNRGCPDQRSGRRPLARSLGDSAAQNRGCPDQRSGQAGHGFVPCEGVEKARPKRAESWRSGRSLRNIVMNLESMRAMVETPGGFADLVAAHGAGALADDLRSGFAGAVSRAASVNRPLRDAVTDPDERAKLLDLFRSLHALRALVTGPFSRAAGILVGFNAQDGD